jgi:hypothetical protein
MSTSLWLRLGTLAASALGSLAFECDGTVSQTLAMGESFTFQSNGEPNNRYRNNANCVWEITFEDENGASLVEGAAIDFDRFHTEGGFDILVIESLVDGEYVETRTLTGNLRNLNTNPLSVSTIASGLRMTFTSDFSVTYGGFEGTVTVVGPGTGTIDVTNPGDQSFVAPGTIQYVEWATTDFPGEFVDIKLYKCEGIPLNLCTSCRAEDDASSTLVAELSKDIPISDFRYEWDVADFVLSDDEIYVIQVRSMFELTICGRSQPFNPYDSPCDGGHELVTDIGQFMNPQEQPGFYSPGEECFWRITADDNKIITVQFNAFDTAPDDKLFAFDGPDSNADPVAGWEDGWSGQQSPPPIESTTNQLFFQFLAETEVGLEHSGWTADYETGLLGDGEYVITSPGNEDGVFEKLQRVVISWTFSGTPGPTTYVKLYRCEVEPGCVGIEVMDVTLSVSTTAGFVEWDIPTSLSTEPNENRYFFEVGSIAKETTKERSSEWLLTPTVFSFVEPNGM